MEKEITVKVTRLRNTLPVETEDVKSPSTQSTPTKKRGGRLATKPQLELIHENATEEIQAKKTRKSTARVVEPDEKVMTPSRRSTRIRSNTSNVSETPTEAEDKGTPSRRSTRIRSNTSLIAETAQFENSPRARRAARRTSLVGSDNESTVTPVKQTRRTRRDSTSSIDKKADSNISKSGIQTNLVIIEEKTDKGKDETQAKDATSQDINDSPSIRRSPRLVEKSAKQTLSQDGHNKENEPDSVETDERLNSDIKTVESSTDQLEQNIVHDDNNLSKSSSNMSNDLGQKSKKKNNTLNNTTSALDKLKSEPKRQRTKSWTTISSSHSNDHCFLSDTEAMKKKTTMVGTTYKSSNTYGSGDGLLISSKNKADTDSSFNHSAEKLTNPIRISTTTLNTEVMNLDNSTSKLNHSSDKNDSKQCGRVVLGNSPKCLVESIVFLEDSDSNASTTDKVNIKYGANPEDQCVPVVKHQLEVAESQNNLSYEPMDIDETITENASLLIFSNNNPAQETENNSILVNNSHDNNTKDVEMFSSQSSDIKDNKNISLNKSKKMSDKDITCDDNESVKKSKRKSSNSSIEVGKRENDTNQSKTCSSSFTVADNDDISKTSSNMDPDHNMSINASKLSFNQEHNNTTKIIKSNRKSSICDTSTDGNKVRKSNRKSSISTLNNVDNSTSILSSGLVKVDYKSIQEPTCDDHDIINDSKKKSKRNSLSADGEVKHSKSKDNGSINSNDDKINILSNNCKIRSSLENEHDIETPNANSSKHGSLTSSDIKNVTENETVTDVINKHESKNKGSKKDNRFIISNKDNDNADESVNKSSRKSSISQASSQSLDKSNNENKSTLVLSQIKDTSETNFEYNEPLSKSLDVPIVKKDIEKKNLSIAYSTSTPLQQKSFKNLGMQLNTSKITPEKKDISTKSNKKSTILSNRKETQSSDEDNAEENSDENDVEEDSDEEETRDKSIFIDTEAKDANDDYESGDSRDEDEKEYEEQNEIIDEGESLDSEEEEFSDDSEYEKGSFVVDSDEEDNNILSGSGDDLSMSVDELTMSAKSKNKYNARKVKEQKKASREMFNARHELNESNKSKSNKHISKKNYRQQLESSDSDVENEQYLQPKRSKRARIDSSQDISITPSDAEKSVSVKKKKIRRLSDSVCEDNAVENEISIDQSISADNIDPLSLQNVVKQEPNTSQKDLNISTVAITSVHEFGKVEIDENVPLIRAKSNLSSDPLQNTMAQDNATDSDESISENEEITKGYDSVLKNLNTIKVKTADTSLNLHKKAKLKSKEPIMEQLNLTQVKSKNTKSKISDENEEKQNVSLKITSKIMANINTSTNQDEDSSDSIDMKLLFNEDSTDSENKIAVEEVPESYIPLKRTEGKMNILESTGGETQNVSFFIDTTGTHTDNIGYEYKDDPSVKTSGKNKKKTSISFADIEQAKEEEQPLNISITGSTKKKKNKLSTGSFDEQETAEPDSKVSISSKDKKEKNKVSVSCDEQKTGELASNISITGSNKKKKKLSLSVDEQERGEHELNISVTGSNKKNKLHLSFDEQGTAEPTSEKAVTDTSTGSVKKGKQINISKNIVENDIIDEPVLEQAVDEKPVRNDKKQKHKDNSKNLIELENAIEDNEIVTDLTLETTSKKRKRKHSANHSISQEAIQNSDTLKQNTCVVAANDKKKRKFSHKEDDIVTTSQDTTKKDKKRKHSDIDDKVSKDNKHDSSEKHLVPRLPAKILKQLNDKPKKDNHNVPKGNFISTTSFNVEKTDKKRIKPSNYLEQSVYLNDSIEEETKKPSLFQPKVCPSVPTVSLSNHGFTTNFKVDVIPQNTQFIFVGKSNDVPNFKQDFLHKHRIKKLGTFDMYKRRRNVKLSKF